MPRFIAVLLLALLLSSCAAPEAAQPDDPGEPYALPSGTLVEKPNLRTLLIMGMGYDQDLTTLASSLTLLVLEGEDKASLLSIPKDTRALVDCYEFGQLMRTEYGRIQHAYAQGEGAGVGEQNVVAAVQRLLGGVRLDGYVMLNVVQLEQLAGIAGEIWVTPDAEMAEAGFSQQRQVINSRIGEYAQYTYLRSSETGAVYSGTDESKLRRHQKLLMEVMRALSVRLGGLDEAGQNALMEEALTVVRSNLTPGALREMVLLAAAAPEVQVEYALLEGEDTLMAPEDFWLPKRQENKAWVLEHFYEPIP